MSYQDEIKKKAESMIKKLKLQPEECFFGTVTREFSIQGFKVTFRLLTSDEVKEIMELAAQDVTNFGVDRTNKRETLKRAIVRIVSKNKTYSSREEIEKVVMGMSRGVIDNLYTLYAGFDMAVQLFMSSEDVDFFAQHLLELRRLSELQMYEASETQETKSSTKQS